MSHKISQSTFWTQVFRRCGEAARTKGLHSFFQSPFWTQVFIVTLFAFTAHVLINGLGLNIVMRYYLLSGNIFMEGTDPYVATLQYGAPNSFKYSPLFGLLFGGMARLYVKFPLFLLGSWILLGNFLLACGLRRWCDMSVRAPLYFVIAVAAALLDTVLSTAAYQINTIVIGVMLLGLAEYRDGRYYSAGALLMLAANLKVYPVIFLAALLLRFDWQYLFGALFSRKRIDPVLLQFRWKFWIGAFVGGVIVFILPAFWVGWTHNFNAHLSWVKAVLGAAEAVRILDITAAFERVGLAGLGVVLNKVVFAGSLVVFYAYAALIKRMDWRPWIVFGIAAMLLVSPRSEIYTYVMLAAAYLPLFYWCGESEFGFVKKYGAMIVTLFAAAGASMRYFIPNWGRSEEPWQIVRLLGALGFWVLTGTVLALSLYAYFKGFKERRAAAVARDNT